MPVAEIFVSAFVTVLIDKLASSLLSKFARHEGIQTQLENWSGTLKMIQAVLNDAEEKQFTDNEAVGTWLDELQVLAYDLDDILDDFLTEALRRESLKAHQEASTSKVRHLLPTCTSFISDLLFDSNMESKLAKITQKLEDLSNKKKDLGLRENVKGFKPYGTGERETTSLVNESDVFGRENDKKEVVKLLLRDETRVGRVPVISIVGMGGVGKTTLAQLAYNDDEVLKGRFDLKIWVCVSDDFDVFTITKQILGVTKAVNLNEAQEKLKEKLINKKFLLVLDDIWNEDYLKWDQLCTPFLVGAPGSKVVVTTRNEKVASIMGSFSIYYLNELLDDDCLSILARHALQERNFKEDPSFKIVAEKLVKKCKGLPLAAKAIGGLLRTKRTLNEWEDILNSKIWEFPEQSSGILPALRLSYHHLPPHLKRLFAYCSIFPKDYEFDKYDLVLLWMAEGFLEQSEGKKRMEEIGILYFNELLSRSFFQRLSRGDESRFVMHDLMNDLAQFVSKGICHRVEDEMKSDEQSAQFGKARHSSFIRQKYDVFTKFKDYNRVRGLRTFLPLPVHKAKDCEDFYFSSKVIKDLLPELGCLRVLSLSGYSITELSNSIGELKHLRYLNLSQTLITHLPESVSNLYNLQMLSLRNCSELCKLPTRIGDLVNLRHLDIGNTERLREMPPGIGNLTNLQTLSKIILDESNTLTVTELRGLSDLRGTLAIIGLQNVKNVRDAREANLLCKQGLEDLTLTWSNNFYDSRRSETLESEVLEVLKPHTKLTKLTKLKMVYYGGIKFPSWVCDPSFVGITNLALVGCKKLKSLPSLGHLPALKELFIEGMAGVKNVGDELYGVGYPQVVAFQSLETLKFENMEGWEEWSFNLTETNDHVSSFPRLHSLIISNCPALVMISLPSLLSLQVLNIRKCDEVVLRGIVSVASLTTIEMDQIIGLSKLHERVVQSLGELRLLEIKNCDELRYLWKEEESSCHNLVNLVDLSFYNCCNLEKLPDLENCLTSLKKLYIGMCPRLQSFQITTKLPTKEKELIESNSNNHNESSSRLERLTIWGFESLTCFLPGQNLPTPLRTLDLGYCSNLEPDSKNFWLLNGSMSTLEMINWVKLTSLPRCLPNFFHLTNLILIGCPGIESFPERGFPPNLRQLRIIRCENLKSLPDDQMQSLTSLVYIHVVNCPCLESFPQGRWPPNLTRLSIGDIKQPISEWGLQRLPTSLVDFSIEGAFPGLVSFSDVGSQLPTSITLLCIDGLVSIESLSMGLQNLTSLQTLCIISCPKLQSLPDLTSLQTLQIWDCPKLQSLPDLTSLRTLEIDNCPKLQSLPDTLLPTLSSLNIYDCPLLKERCSKEKRDYWPRISHIPRVMIDYELIQ